MGRLQDLIRAQDERVNRLREADSQIRSQEARVSAAKSELVTQETAYREMRRQRILLVEAHRRGQWEIEAERRRTATGPSAIYGGR